MSGTGVLSYDKGASGFDQTFGLPMRQFIPTLLEMARLAPGQRVLDVATGTGAAAEFALNVIGPSGHVTALDIAAPMLDEARRRLGLRPNVVFGLQDGQSLTLPDEAFDAVLCSMALMIFKDRSGALAGFHRVLRKGGYAAVSLNTTAERSLTSHIRTALAQVLPERAAEIAAGREPHYGLGRPERIRPLFEAVGFQDVVTHMETRCFTYPSFADYYEPIAGGGGPWGDEHAALPPDVQLRVREETARILTGDSDPSGPIEVYVDILFASGRK
jgi:ubiquinone/menaquinone biosynthesis C-methylase UbiE